MKKLYLLFLLLIPLISGCNSNKVKIGPHDFAIQNVNIINVENGKVQQQMTVIINGDQIGLIEETTNVELSKSNKIIDGRGKYLIPGLWDMHTHFSSETVTRNSLYPLFIANGITGARVMSADCFEPCWELDMTIDQSRGLQEEVKTGKLIGPKVILGSTYIHGAKPGEPSTVREPGNSEDGKKLVNLLIERGVDFIKIYDEVPRQAYFGMANQANKKGLPFAGHVPTSVKASEASDAGQKSIEHCCAGSILEECSFEEERLRKEITELLQSREPKNMYDLVLELVKTYDSIKCQELFQKFVKNNTFYTPTLIATEMDNILATENWRDDPNLKYVPKKELEFWEKDEIITREVLGRQDPLIRQKRFEIVGRMNQIGVKLLAGSDCGVFGVHYGLGLHHELELLVEAGLTELEALQTATINAAKYQNDVDNLGTIDTNKVADLVLLNSNPLEDIRNTQDIDALFVNGQYLNRIQLDSILLGIETYIKNEKLAGL